MSTHYFTLYTKLWKQWCADELDLKFKPVFCFCHSDTWLLLPCCWMFDNMVRPRPMALWVAWEDGNSHSNQSPTGQIPKRMSRSSSSRKQLSTQSSKVTVRSVVVVTVVVFANVVQIQSCQVVICDGEASRLKLELKLQGVRVNRGAANWKPLALVLVFKF
jgi:hypothetical protein